jgi:hypothetical protein
VIQAACRQYTQRLPEGWAQGIADEDSEGEESGYAIITLQPRAAGVVESVLAIMGMDLPNAVGEYADQIAMAAAAGTLGIGVLAAVRWAGAGPNGN